MTAEQRMTFQKWFQTLAMSAMALIAGWVGYQIQDLNKTQKELSKTIQQLSEQIAVVSTDAKRDREDMRDLKDRMRSLEARR